MSDLIYSNYMIVQKTAFYQEPFMSTPLHPEDTQNTNMGNRLNVLRAGVLGANDGIVSTAGLIIGVAGATTDTSTLLISGLAGMAAGALSMGGGEYVSVSTQRDTEQSAIQTETQELKDNYQGEIDELTEIYEQKGLSAKLAKQVTIELMEKDALSAHAEAELNIDPKHYTNPWSAAGSSICAFSVGGLLPLLSIMFWPTQMKVIGTFIVVIIALAMTGYISAMLGNASRKKAVFRNITVGILTMLVTFSLGKIIGS